MREPVTVSSHVSHLILEPKQASVQPKRSPGRIVRLIIVYIILYSLFISLTTTTVRGLTIFPAAEIGDQPDTEDPGEQERLNYRQADQILGLTNRLLRCYRAITRDSTITELSRASASPFRFRIFSGGADPPAWESQLSYPADPLKVLPKRLATITNQVRSLLGTGNEPEVSTLFLLDAERALHDGRFRETVLFCWSTIDATFNRKYDELVDAKLTGEWTTARDFFKGVDFGLKNKMSAALFLVGGRSLFRETGDLWQKISNSYNKRNGIIHRGENANEDEARLALNVARKIVEIMSGL
jgi:hypothetical protein